MDISPQNRLYSLLDRLLSEAKESFLFDDVDNFEVLICVPMTPLDKAVLQAFVCDMATELFADEDFTELPFQKDRNIMLWINPEKKGFNQLGDFIHVEFDPNKESPRFDCQEVRFITCDDGSIIIGMLATAIQGVSSKCNLTYPFVCALTLHTSEYEVYDLDAKGRIKVQPSLTEKLLIKQLETIDLEGCYAGWIEYKPVLPEIAALIEAGTIPSTQIPLFGLAVIDSCPTIASLRLESSKNGTKKGGGYAAKAQTELERLTDRQAFLCNYLTFVVGDEVTPATAPMMLLKLNDLELTKLGSIMALYR